MMCPWSKEDPLLVPMKAVYELGMALAVIIIES